MYECCGRSFEAKGLQQHLDNSHAHSNEIQCHWCFARWPTHDGKLRLKHEEKRHWLKCEYCTWIFKTKDGLEEHVDEEHPPNYCYGCKRSFQSPNNLNQVSRSIQQTFSQLKKSATSTSNHRSMSGKTSNVPGAQIRLPI